jgi:hypothetical protein
MIILGKPKDIDKFVCVNSKQCVILSELGFVPMYREIGVDNIYFLKNNDLERVVRKWNLKTK